MLLTVSWPRTGSKLMLVGGVRHNLTGFGGQFCVNKSTYIHIKAGYIVRSLSTDIGTNAKCVLMTMGVTVSDFMCRN